LKNKGFKMNSAPGLAARGGGRGGEVSPFYSIFLKILLKYWVLNLENKDNWKGRGRGIKKTLKNSTFNSLFIFWSGSGSKLR
jgi:hypothetical protein